MFVELTGAAEPNDSDGVVVVGAPNDNTVAFGAVDDAKLGNCVLALTGVTETADVPNDKVGAAAGCAPNDKVEAVAGWAPNDKVGAAAGCAPNDKVGVAVGCAPNAGGADDANDPKDGATDATGVPNVNALVVTAGALSKFNFLC